jgi:hypothetical protein
MQFTEHRTRVAPMVIACGDRSDETDVRREHARTASKQPLLRQFWRGQHARLEVRVAAVNDSDQLLQQGLGLERQRRVTANDGL